MDIVHHSSHPQNRIAATLFHEQDGWAISQVNFWPEIIDKTFGRDARIGNSSGTIHAETACLFKAAFENGHKCQGASIAVTDPPCPNCVKNMAEAGIDNIYIDHKGFHKDFAKRRIEYFQTLSVRLAQKAGISIYEVNRKDGSIVPITIADKAYIPFNEKPVQCFSDSHQFRSPDTISSEIKTALAYCLNGTKTVQVVAVSHPALGFDSIRNDYEITHPETKYSYIQEACNRLLMYATRHRLIIQYQTVHVSETPTSREFVNLIGAGITNIHISDTAKVRDEYSLQAKKLLEENGIINFNE